MSPALRMSLIVVSVLLLVIAGLSRTSFVIEETVDIDAPPSRVWAVIADHARYAEWNTQLAWLGAPASLGATLHLRLAAEGADPYEFKPLVTAWEPERRFTWLAITGIPRVFDGEHTFTLEPLGERGTRVVNREEYRGVLSLLMKNLPMMAGAPAGFRKMNDELRRRAEAP